MYRELREFAGAIATDSAFWKDGEFWSALIVGVGTSAWCYYDPTAVPDIRAHFDDLLTVASIVFGFVLTTLFFYVQAAGSWADDPRVNRVAERLVNWHVWTIFCLIGLIAYVLLLWSFGERLQMGKCAKAFAYGVLGFATSYSGFQIVNHTLTVRWAFRRRHDLQAGPPPKCSLDHTKSNKLESKAEGTDKGLNE
jgi:hypothetical protein